MKEHSKISELSDEEIDNLSDGEFKALAIRMFKVVPEVPKSCLIFFEFFFLLYVPVG